LNEKFGLDSYKMDDLVNEAIEFPEEPIHGQTIPEVQEGEEPVVAEVSSDFADLSEDEAHNTNVNEELR
jgi:hypothetical protein